MRLKQLGNQWRVYLNPHDFHRLWAQAESRRALIAIQLGGECGLRVNETTNVTPNAIRKSTAKQYRDHYFIGIYGKDTTGETEQGKFREVYLPKNLHTIIEQEIEAEDIAPDETLMPVTKRTVQEYIKRAAIACAEQYNEPDYAKISSHDLRAYWASNLLIRHKVDENVIMDLGGWASRENMEPYLNAQFDDVIAREMEEAGVADRAYNIPNA